MAPAYNDAVKSVLSDVNKFVSITLQSESLSKKAENERQKLVKALEKLFADNHSLSAYSDEGSTSSHKSPSISGSIEDSKNTLDSSHGSEEDYDDKILSSWQKKRYFVLHKKIMYCFKKPADPKQTTAFLVTGYEFREAPQLIKDAKKKDCCFELVAPGKKTHQACFVMAFCFLADSKEDLLAWKEVLEAEMTSSAEEALEMEGEDFYEPLPDSDLQSGSGVTTSPPKAQEQTEVRIEVSGEDAEEDGEVYEDGTSEPTPTPSAPQPSSSNKSPSFLSKITTGFFKKKDSEVVEKKESIEVAKDKGEDKNPEDKDSINEFIDDDEIYEEVGSETPRPPPPPPARATAPAVANSKEEADASSMKAPSSSSASYSPPNAAPKLPKRNQLTPVAAETSTPALPPRSPPASRPPPHTERDLPPRPPNIPVPPIPSPGAKEPQPLCPQLDKSISHPRDEDFENLFYGAWACQGNSDSELTFSRGDLIHVISRDLEAHNWWVGELSGKIGLVPKAFLIPAYVEVN
ncbi:src kinase-associated phosphoprotein 2 [Plakobranchus ocellatus]|uniref:Src kinase-associated phosphoprotein 2 n=1 Tax=Plakobranchus ocellatus TaxID=259542 RepID=A0AAV4BAJ9_9GAST|nr:src kinase-associated phosphoprotein 2 [Plakobranchus ocellatus]